MLVSVSGAWVDVHLLEQLNFSVLSDAHTGVLSSLYT